MTKAVQMPSAAGAVDAPRGARRAAQGGMAGEGTRSLRPWYGLMALGGGLGTVTAAWQTVERIAWAADPKAPSVCEINTVLSCSSVYPHWQSSALGIPNSLVALPVFAFLLSAGLAGLGVAPPRWPPRVPMWSRGSGWPDSSASCWCSACCCR